MSASAGRGGRRRWLRPWCCAGRTSCRRGRPGASTWPGSASPWCGSVTSSTPSVTVQPRGLLARRGRGVGRGVPDRVPAARQHVRPGTGEPCSLPATQAVAVYKVEVDGGERQGGAAVTARARLEVEGCTRRPAGVRSSTASTWRCAAARCTSIMGPNGSGKSTLAHALMGRPGNGVTAGSITDGRPGARRPARLEAGPAGLFLALQHPVEVPGVGLRLLLEAASTAEPKRRPRRAGWSTRRRPSASTTAPAPRRSTWTSREGRRSGPRWSSSGCCDRRCASSTRSTPGSTWTRWARWPGACSWPRPSGAWASSPSPTFAGSWSSWRRTWCT